MSGSLLKFQRTVKIGGRRYPVVKIGNQLWMAENLDYVDENITIGGELSISTPKAYYYDQDKELNGPEGRKINLLYNYAAVNYLMNNSSTIFPDGWHVCSDADVSTLINFIGSDEGIKLSKGDISWKGSLWIGTNDYGFSWLPGGTRWESDGQFHSIGEEACMWSSNFNLIYIENTKNDSSIHTQIGGAYDGASSNIRLVKDIT